MLRLLAESLAKHDPALVLLAGMICMLACHTALGLAARPAGKNWSRTPWLACAAIVMGCGAWTTHLVLLLAFQPGLPATYHPGVGVLAGIIAVAGSCLGFVIADRSKRMALGGLVQGLAFAAMVYVALSGVSFPAEREWDPVIVAGSILVGAAFATASRLRAQSTPNMWGLLVGAALLAAALLGTHFCAVAGLTLHPRPGPSILQPGMGALWFAIAITATNCLILAFGLIGGFVDSHIARFESAKRELEMALQRADAANATKSMFLANMSHELRTPLNAIIGFSEIMKAEMFGPLGGKRYREYVEDIAKCGNHLLSLINDVLDMSKFDAGRLELDEEKVDVSEIVVASVNAVRPSAEKASVCLTSKLDDALFLYADGRRLKQILLNLLSNAIKFTPEGGRVSLSVSARQEGLIIAVADTGIGMAPDQIPKALERFGQVDSRLARKHEGTGLGLPLTKCLVDLHGGSLRIDSEVNVGTTVTVTFPRARLLAQREAA
jgi:signal transduction histidine kinase